MLRILPQVKYQVALRIKKKIPPEKGSSFFNYYRQNGLDNSVVNSCYILLNATAANGYSIINFNRKIGVVAFFVYSTGTYVHFPDNEKNEIKGSIDVNASFLVNERSGILLRQYYNYGFFSFPFPLWTNNVLLGSSSIGTRALILYYI